MFHADSYTVIISAQCKQLFWRLSGGWGIVLVILNLFCVLNFIQRFLYCKIFVLENFLILCGGARSPVGVFLSEKLLFFLIAVAIFFAVVLSCSIGFAKFSPRYFEF